MKNKILYKTIIIFIISVVVIVAMIFCLARFVFLSPACYSDNENLTEQENYFIKKIVLEAVEDRLSFFASDDVDIYDSDATKDEVIQLDKTENNRKHVFVLINSDFMKSVVKENDDYTVIVKSYGMESFSDDCLYVIRLNNEFAITFFGLDP